MLPGIFLRFRYTYPLTPFAFPHYSFVSGSSVSVSISVLYSLYKENQCKGTTFLHWLYATYTTN